MDLRQLRYFLAVAETGSFSRAAVELQIAQPAISVSVRKLEQTLGLSLFHREDRRIQLTAEGQVLMEHVRRILRQVQDAELEMRELRGLTEGEVRIGIPGMLGSYFFPPILMAFKHRYPGLTLRVFEAGTRGIGDMIRRGELDLGVVVSDPVPDDLETKLFLREEMVVCVAPDHPFATLDAIPPKRFFGEELVLFKKGYYQREYVETLSRETGLAPKVAFETDLIVLSKSLIAQGFGIGTFLRRVIRPEDALVAVPFDPPKILNLSLAWRKGGYLTHADRAFLEFMLDQREREEQG